MACRRERTYDWVGSISSDRCQAVRAPAGSPARRRASARLFHARTERDQRGRSWHAYSRQDGLVIEETALADREVPVRIAIPEDAPATGDKGVYWELVVEGAGVNAAFPVIVY